MAAPTFQEVILALQAYWAKQGCLLWQPVNTEVGAGTMNPATFLRVLGPEPWRVGYMEPSVRPADGRYGENPNRLGQFFQYQVILKPDPGNPLELYLQSLEALGVSQRDNDVRFVEDNWAAPALGAWGLGWEVWLNGQEITQYTYFQQAGGIELKVPSVEITYGIERILMALQRTTHFKDIRWTGELTYGEMFLQSEVENSRYNFEVADVERLREVYAHYDGEARAALATGLVLPAHTYLLKCSHTFNVLDARGAVGVTERAQFFARMRELAAQVAQAYLAQREQAGFPLVGKFPGARSTPKFAVELGAAPKKAAPFVLEVGVEELPSDDLETAQHWMRESFERDVLAANDLAHGAVRVAATPRRLIVRVEDLAPASTESEKVERGPHEAAAFDAHGQPTPALLGWARKMGVPNELLNRGLLSEVGGKRHVTFTRRVGGRSTAEVLNEALPRWLDRIRFDRPMRWAENVPAFSRPIRWLLALYGERVIPFEYAGLAAGRTTRGLRWESPTEFEVRNAADYAKKLAGQGIVLDPDERRTMIREQIDRLASEIGGRVGEDADLLREVANLVEQPLALRGEFDGAFLALPPEVLVSVMKRHQRYFPVEPALRPLAEHEGKLMAYFIAVRNGDAHGLDQVREGNEHVLRARFADADFFVREDRKHKLEAFRPRLATLAFQNKLGSMLEKSERIRLLTQRLAPLVGLEPGEVETALRAAFLCKADLATQMVIEMTSLQGVMGRTYALDSGESPQVAQAIFEHYLPRGAEDVLPASGAGLVVGLADRLDSLAGLFAVGLAPTGARDPFALRRAALGILQVLLGRNLALNLRAAVDLAAEAQPVRVTPEVKSQVLEFLAGRLRGVLADQGYRYDIVEAVLGERAHNPALARQAAHELAAWVARSEWPQVLAAYARCVRITREVKESFPVDPGRFAHPAESALWQALQPLEQQVAAWREKGELGAHRFLSAFVPIIPTVSSFFEDVLVMAEDRMLRENRLGLLQRIARLPQGVIDLSKLEGF
jgi:glycyl-tRNA synthetase